jgi:hypothetical protein
MKPDNWINPVRRRNRVTGLKRLCSLSSDHTAWVPEHLTGGHPADLSNALYDGRALVAVTNDEFQRPNLANDLCAVRSRESGHEGQQHLPHPPAERLEGRAEGSERR